MGEARFLNDIHEEEDYELNLVRDGDPMQFLKDRGEVLSLLRTLDDER